MRVKSEAKRQAILDIAKEAFSEQGFGQTSMSAIAKLVGGSKATLYNYFNSKEEIFAAVMEDSATRDIAGAFNSLSIDRDCETELKRFGVNYLKSILTPEISAIRRMAISEASRSEIGRHFYKNGPLRGRKFIAQYLQRCIDKHELVNCDVTIAAAQLISLLEAEVLAPYELGAIAPPNLNQIQLIAERAITAFLAIYRT